MTVNLKNSFTWKNVRLVPTLHNRMEFAIEVGRQFETFRPEMVAVEFPVTLEKRILQGVERLPLLSVVYYEEADGAFTYLLLEPTDGVVEALRLARAEGIAVRFIDRDTEGYPMDFSPMPDPYAAARIGTFLYGRTYLHIHSGDERSPDDILREKTMAYHLQRLSREAERVLFVGGLSHLPSLLHFLDHPQTEVIGRHEREGVGIAHLQEESSREIMTEMPFLAAEYERSRSAKQPVDIDRMEVNSRLLDLASDNYRKKIKEELSRPQLKTLYKFARNYALLTGALVPTFYQLVVAARGVADDDFAYEVWELGSRYPWQAEAPGLPVLRLLGEDLYLDQKRIKFHRRLRTTRRRLVPIPVRKKRRERKPGEWKREFHARSICSYPPEDVVIEGYGRYLQKKALQIKTEENIRIEPFTSSLADGIDIRETIRDWARQKIYVRVERPFRGKVGSVVVIFDPDFPDKEGKERFPWCVTWLGEHDQESDMAFYSTPAGEVMDGPGISRCQYGGFMLAYPPMRVYDIWKDPYFHFARNKPERLLMAALDYSIEKHVVYVSATPPTGWCSSIAAGLGKKIIYLPIGIFSPVTLKKIRRFHVLDGHPVRKIAHHYV
jgi:hypothetical protein